MLTIENIESRKKGIGGSDASVILGHNKYKSIGELYLEKIGEGSIIEENEYMYWGNQLEDKIVSEFMRREKKVVTTPVNTFKHPEHEWMIAHIDGLVTGESAILECKTSSEYRNKEWGDEGTDDIPTEYLMQCIHYAAVLNVERVYIAVLIGGNKFKTFKYERNLGIEKKLIMAEKNFWENNVIPGIPPQDTDVVNIEYADNESITVDFKVKELFEEYKSKGMLKRKLEKEVLSLRDEITEEVGQTGMVIDEYGNNLGKIVSRNQSRFDTGKFRVENKGLYECYQKNVTYVEVRV